METKITVQRRPFALLHDSTDPTWRKVACTLSDGRAEWFATYSLALDYAKSSGYPIIDRTAKANAERRAARNLAARKALCRAQVTRA